MELSERVWRSANRGAVERAARHVGYALSLVEGGHASEVVEVQPGDGTRYIFVVSSSEREVFTATARNGVGHKAWFVSIMPGERVYQWAGDFHLDYGYIRDKWEVSDWTAIIAELFLNTLCDYMKEAH